MVNGTINPYAAAAVGASLVLFGVLYNQLVAWLERSGHDRGYTAFLVVGGTAITLAGAIPLVGLVPTLVVLGCFAASGLPMVIGSWARSSQARKTDEITAIAVAKEMLDDQPQSGWVRNAAGDYPGSER